MNRVLFDLGVRREAAGEGRRLARDRFGELFEQCIGLELIRACRLRLPGARLRYWRVPEGPAVDWVVEHEGRMAPVEVKWTDRTRPSDARHLETFLAEHHSAEAGFVVCQAPRSLALSERVTAIPWQSLGRRGGPILDALDG